MMSSDLIHALAFIGFTLDTVGKISVAFTAVQVHHRFWQEHKIDDAVFKTMHKERLVGIVGIGLMVVGFILQLPVKFPNF